jgi:hypothetical protein
VAAVPGAREAARTPLLRSPILPARLSYGQLKAGVAAHAEAARQLERRLAEQGAGLWVGKPGEQDAFPV